MARIHLPNGKIVTAPDNLSKDQYDEIVTDALQKTSNPSSMQEMANTAAMGTADLTPIQDSIKSFIHSRGFLPLAGMTAAGLASGGLGIPAAIGMSALGAAGGAAAQQIKEAAQGKLQPSSGAAAREIAGQGAMGALAEVGGQGLKAGLKAFGPEARRIGPGLINTITGIPEKSTQALVENPQATAKLAQLGEKGIMGHVVDAVKSARISLGNFLKNSNSQYKSTLEDITASTKGEKIIPVQDIASNTLKDAQQKGFVPGLPSTDRVGLSVIKRFTQSIHQLAGPSGKLSSNEANLLRVQVNAALGNQSLSNQTRSVLQTFKDSLDAGIEEGIGKDLAAKYTANLEQASTARRLSEKLQPILNSRNGPMSIAKSLESSDELGLNLAEFEQVSGNPVFGPIRQALRAIPFGAETKRGILSGSTGAMGLKGPYSIATNLPYVGRLIAPPMIAKGTAALQRLPQTQLPFSRTAIFASPNIFRREQP